MPAHRDRGRPALPHSESSVCEAVPKMETALWDFMCSLTLGGPSTRYEAVGTLLVSVATKCYLSVLIECVCYLPLVCKIGILHTL